MLFDSKDDQYPPNIKARIEKRTTIPSGLDEQGLPLAVLIGSKPMEEEKLFTVAARCERLLSFTFSPV